VGLDPDLEKWVRFKYVQERRLTLLERKINGNPGMVAHNYNPRY
jgi:hypothetical protein